MAIKSVHVGPRSRVLEAKDAQDRLLGAKVMGGLLGDDPVPEDLKAPVLACGGPTSLRGCGCGKWHLPAGEDCLEIDGVVHRFSRPCYEEGESKARSYLDFKAPLSLESRVAALEKVVADLVQRLTNQ